VISSPHAFKAFENVLTLFEHHTGVFSAALTLVSVGIASFAAWVSSQQVKRLAESDRIEMAPYLTASYAIRPRSNGTQVIWLDIKNHGRTPAYQVVVRFTWNEWNRSSQPENYPFLEQKGGLAILAPGEARSYYVCTLADRKLLLEKQPVSPEISISYQAAMQAPVQDHSTVKQKLDLSDLVNLYKGR